MVYSIIPTYMSMEIIGALKFLACLAESLSLRSTFTYLVNATPPPPPLFPPVRLSILFNDLTAAAQQHSSVFKLLRECSCFNAQ